LQKAFSIAAESKREESMVEARRVEVVLINYKRPANVRAIVKAFREQTVPCDIALIDAAADQEFQLDKEVLDNVDVVYRCNKNFGPFDRYVPIGAFYHEFTYFHDDDMLPGNRLIEHFVNSADSLPGFGVLGQQGRIVDERGGYHPSRVDRRDAPVPVDIVVRGFFVRTSNLPALLQQRTNFGLIPSTELEDDLLLCTAMNMILGLTNYLTPIDVDPETKMNKSEMSGAHARHERWNHVPARTGFCSRAIASGWVPLSHTADFHDLVTASQVVPSSSHVGFDVNAYWLKRGKTYMAENQHTTLPYAQQELFIIDALRSHEVPMRTVLEIGCGYGRITRRLAEAFPEAQITAVDISPDQLRNARAHCADFLDRISFHEYDIQSQEPLPGDSFDTAIAVVTLQHHPPDYVHSVVERLLHVADNVVNYDWSEPYTGPVAAHVWNHDYAEIYRTLGYSCQVLADPIRFHGQQHKLFIVSKRTNGNSRHPNHPITEHSTQTGAQQSSGTATSDRPNRERTTTFHYLVDRGGSKEDIEINLQGLHEDDHVYQQIAKYRSFYEKDLLDHLVARGPLGGVYIDVGANIGNHSVFFGKFLADLVVAIEPVPTLAQILRRNLAVNGVHNHLVLTAAVSSEKGRGKLVLPPASHHNVGSTRVAMKEDSEAIERDALSVPVTTLDHIVEQLDPEAVKKGISLIKLDAEGMELAVLMGARKVLDVHRPQLVVELATRRAFDEATSFLSEWGYQDIGRFCGTATYHFIVPGFHHLRGASPQGEGR
jgi:FkbM family methyltransferase